jgi:UrcA family protein
MAAVPLTAVSSVAHAAEAQVVRVADLNLSNTADAARFKRRVDSAATQICGGAHSALQIQAACRTAVREEAMEKLSDGQRQNLQIALARTNGSVRQVATGF